MAQNKFKMRMTDPSDWSNRKRDKDRDRWRQHQRKVKSERRGA